MYTFLLALHNLLRWVVLLLLVINIIRHFAAINRPFAAIDKKLGLWLMITAHIQLLIGLYEWFAGAYGLNAFKTSGSGVMKDSSLRFFSVEHGLTMLIAILLITVARGIYRKHIPDSKKHRRCIVLYTIALILVLAMIPWPGVYDFGRRLLPAF